MGDSLGPYRLLRPFRRGGMSELYLAEDPRKPDSPPLVVKRLHRHLAVHADAIDLFLQEARLALACAGHPNIAEVVDHGTDGDAHYIAMQYVGAVTLGDLRDEQPALGQQQPGATLAILIDSCAALAHVHAHKVIHRDVHPHNIVVGDEGIARLIDFGVAAPEPVTGTGNTNRGTWAYMSPEQVQGIAMDRRSDIFSLGVVLWELFSGERLFHRGPPYLTMAAVVEEPIPALPDDELQVIAARSLARDPAERYATAEELAEALEALARRRALVVDRSVVAALIV